MLYFTTHFQYTEVCAYFSPAHLTFCRYLKVIYTGKHELIAPAVIGVNRGNDMGIFSNLLQQTHIISEKENNEKTIERRLDRLERELHYTQTMLHRLIEILEHQNEDSDNNCTE